MSQLQLIQAWIPTVFNDSTADAITVNNLVNVVLSVFTIQQLQTFQAEFTQIADISQQSISPEQVVALTTAVKNIVSSVYALLQTTKSSIDPADLNLIKSNLKIFVQVVVLVVLYDIQDKVNVQAIIPYLPALSELASYAVNRCWSSVQSS